MRFILKETLNVHPGRSFYFEKVKSHYHTWASDDYCTF